jgi:hypothetical protein
VAQILDAFPISGAFAAVTGLFPDLSRWSSRANSLTLSDLFNPLGHSPYRLIPPIEPSTFTANSSFNIQRLISTNSWFRVGLPSSRCDGTRSLSPPLPHDRCHALQFRMVLSERVQAADGPRRCGRCSRDLSRPLCGTRGWCVFAGFRPLALGTWRGGQGAMRGTRENTDGVPYYATGRLNVRDGDLGMNGRP